MVVNHARSRLSSTIQGCAQRSIPLGIVLHSRSPPGRIGGGGRWGGGRLEPSGRLLSDPVRPGGVSSGRPGAARVAGGQPSRGEMRTIPTGILPYSHLAGGGAHLYPALPAGSLLGGRGAP